MNLKTSLISEERTCRLGGSSNLDLFKRIELTVDETSKPYFKKILNRLALESPENAKIICDYIQAEISQINIKQSTKEGKIKVLVWLSNHNSGKLFNQMNKHDILDYLNSLRRSTTDDQSQRWVGSYNGRQIILSKFFRWLYNPEESDSTKRITPPCLQGVKRLPRREKTSYKHSDIWQAIEHVTFLKYCPDKRDRCYHAMARDMSARPHEILNLRINDIKFNLTSDGAHYADVVIREGKTGPRTLVLIDSIPYVKEWIQAHPTGTNVDSWLFVSKCTSTVGEKLTYDGIAYRYHDYYRRKYFPRLLNDKTVPDVDKAYIRNMLTKPWNLYVLRHSALTEKSQELTDNLLRDHAGWSMSSKMTEIYVHLRGESSRVLLEKKGIIHRENKSTTISAKRCPSCNEPNKPQSKVCANCKMILSYDAYIETTQQTRHLEEKYEKEIKQVREEMNQQFAKIMSMLQRNPHLVNIKPEIILEKIST